MRAFDWYRNERLWMTFNGYRALYYTNHLFFGTKKNLMQIVPHRQQQKFSPLIFLCILKLSLQYYCGIAQCSCDNMAFLLSINPWCETWLLNRSVGELVARNQAISSRLQTALDRLAGISAENESLKAALKRSASASAQPANVVDTCCQHRGNLHMPLSARTFHYVA